MEVALWHASPKPVRLPPDLEGLGLGRVIAKAVAKEPNNRYDSAQGMLDDLERAAQTLGPGVSLRTVTLSPLGVVGEATTTPDGGPQPWLVAATPEAPTPEAATPEAAIPQAPLASRKRPMRGLIAVGVLALMAVVGWLLMNESNRPPSPLDSQPPGQQGERPDSPAQPPARVLESATERGVTQLRTEFSVSTGALSADGTRVAYVDVGGTLWVEGVYDGSLARVAVELDGATMVSWFPDGRRLVLSGAGPVFQVDVETGARTELYPRADAALLSPDGHWLVSMASDGMSLMPVPAGSTRSLLNGGMSPMDPIAWSPDGDRIATVPVWSSYSLYALSLDGSALVEMVSDAQLGSWYFGVTMAWLDANSFLYTRTPDTPTLGTELCYSSFPASSQTPECVTRWDHPVGLMSNLTDGRILIQRTSLSYDIYLTEVGDDGLPLGPMSAVTRDDRPDIPGLWLGDRTWGSPGSRRRLAPAGVRPRQRDGQPLRGWTI
jgi:hypothetical protein